MSNVPVFLFSNVIINDEEQYREDEKGFFPILKKFGGEFITYADNPITLEGASPPFRADYFIQVSVGASC